MDATNMKRERMHAATTRLRGENKQYRDCAGTPAPAALLRLSVGIKDAGALIAGRNAALKHG